MNDEQHQTPPVLSHTRRQPAERHGAVDLRQVERCLGPRQRTVVARDAHQQPRTYRLAARPAQRAAYRRLAVAILGLDVAHLAAELRGARAA